jgi:hypothetical protein
MNVLLQLFKPYLTPMEAEEVRAEVVACKPKLHLVMADWPWLEVRGVTELRAKALIEGLRVRGMKFKEIGKKKREVLTI